MYVVRIYNGNAYLYYVAFYRSLWQRVSLFSEHFSTKCGYYFGIKRGRQGIAIRIPQYFRLYFALYSMVICRQPGCILVGTIVVVNSYMRLRNKFKLFPAKNQASDWLTQQVHCILGLEWRAGMVFGRQWLEFISQSQIKGDYNFRYYLCMCSVTKFFKSMVVGTVSTPHINNILYFSPFLQICRHTFQETKICFGPAQTKHQNRL